MRFGPADPGYYRWWVPRDVVWEHSNRLPVQRLLRPLATSALVHRRLAVHLCPSSIAEYGVCPQYKVVEGDTLFEIAKKLNLDQGEAGVACAQPCLLDAASLPPCLARMHGPFQGAGVNGNRGRK